MTLETVAPAAAGVREWSSPKPRIVFFRIKDLGLPEFVNGHFRDHVRCLEQFFDLFVAIEDAAQSQGASSVAGPAGALGRVAAGLGYRHGQFPVTEIAADRILSLPMFPHPTECQQAGVASAVVAAVKHTQDGGRSM